MSKNVTIIPPSENRPAILRVAAYCRVSTDAKEQEYYLAGASLGKIVNMLNAKGILSPSGNPKWARAAVDKLLSNAKYIPIVDVNQELKIREIRAAAIRPKT